MVGSLLLAGCGAPPIVPTTVTGLQVVATRASPAQPGPFDPLVLETWVADALGHGNDVLVWSCIPYQGRCLEQDALGGGMPLAIGTRLGHADPSFRVAVPWPTFAHLALLLADADLEGPSPRDLALAGFVGDLPDDLPTNSLGLLVWTLACVPGQCPIMEMVAANPPVGSRTWEQAWDLLADPTALVADVEPREASVAVKFVPLWVEGQGTYEGQYLLPNTNPVLRPYVDPASSATASFTWADPDGEEVEFQGFTTGGAIDVTEPAPGRVDIQVTSTDDSSAATGERFLVGVDGRGGTAVWTSATEAGECRAELEILWPPNEGIDLSFQTVPVRLTAPLPQSGGDTGSKTWTGSSYGYGTYREDYWNVGVEVRGSDDLLLWSGWTLLSPDGANACPTTRLSIDDVYDSADYLPICEHVGDVATVTATATGPGFQTLVETTTMVIEHPRWWYCPASP